MLNPKNKRNVVHNNDSQRAKPEPTVRYSDNSQSAARFQLYLENRGCPIRLSAPKSDDVQWID